MSYQTQNDHLVFKITANCTIVNSELLYKLYHLLFAYDTVFVVDSQEKLRCLVEEFWTACERRKLTANVCKNKVMKCTKDGEGDRMNSFFEWISTWRCKSV